MFTNGDRLYHVTFTVNGKYAAPNCGVRAISPDHAATKTIESMRRAYGPMALIAVMGVTPAAQEANE